MVQNVHAVVMKQGLRTWRGMDPNLLLVTVRGE